MTVGQRIAQKRKESGLSQEALGEQLGVSRQAIYKWESDSALPEIEKLVALSRIFSVPVGWLLGVEEEAPSQESVPGGELTEEQLKMVQEIVDRYLEVRPQPEAPKRRRWPFVVAGLVLIVVFANLFSRLSELKQQYSNLQNSIYNVTTNVNRDIASITDRVEEVLKSQNELTADYGTELVRADLTANTVTFRVWATPKTYVEGMTVRFTADNGEAAVSGLGVEGSNRQFAVEITCGLTDDIQLSVCFITDQQEETQLLDRYEYLYSDSFPFVYTTWPLWFSVKGDVLEADVNDLHGGMEPGKDFGNGQQAEVVDFKVGLFKDQKLVMWYTETTRPIIMNGETQLETVYEREEDIPLERGHVYVEAVVATDQFGRVRLYMDAPLEYKEDEGEWGQVNSYTTQSDPEGWVF